MEQTTIPVRSITNAMRGKALLERRGFTVYIQRAFRNEDTNGCGYSLLVNGNGEQARQILESAGLRVSGRGK